MFLIKGNKRFRTKEIAIAEPYTCPYCNARFTTNLIFYSVYFHVFWIPIIATDKEAEAYCTDCKKLRGEANFGPALITIFKEERKKIKHSWYSYTGIIAIGIIIALLIFGNLETQSKFNRYSQRPKTGDIYTIRNEMGYSLFRIVEVKKDSAIIQKGTYFYLFLEGISDVKNKSADSLYDNDFKIVPLSYFGKLYDEGNINGLERQ